MKNYIVSLLFCFATAFAAHCQTSDPVVFEIAGQKIHKSEFMKEFLRSIGQSPEAAPTACTYEKRKKLEEYVDLFVNYRVKLADAFSLGFDTMPTLVNELASYRAELASPYLMDSVTMQNVLNEAYERNHYVLHAAHILIRVDGSASPSDTLMAYNMAQEAYQRAVAGEDFYALSSEYADKQIPPDQRQFRRKNNREGDLGAFTVFDMIYPFENTSYSLQPGEISKPIRTRFGYHVIKLISKSEYYGNTTLQHIWVSGGNRPEKAESRIKLAYSKLREGVPFERVARDYSDDGATNTNGGLLSDMPLPQMPPEYIEEIAKGLKCGEYSAPFHTIYGWHIIKLIRRDVIPSLEELTPLYKQKLSRDKRNNEPQEVFVEKNLKKYGFVDYTTTYGSWKLNNGSWTFTAPKKVTKKSTYASSLAPVCEAITDSVFRKRWIFDSTQLSDHRPLMELAGKLYTVDDFCKFIAMNQTYSLTMNHEKYVAQKYKNYIGKVLMDYADSQLETENPDFADLMNEYRHGLMIFAYNDKYVWSKAITDTLGFVEFYSQASLTHQYDNPVDSIYFWNERARVNVVYVPDSAILHPDKALKIVEKAAKKGWSSNEMVERLSAKVDKQYKDSIVVKLDLYEKGNQRALSSNEWRKGVYVHPEGHGYLILQVQDILDPERKDIREARGYYINDYQNALESQLVNRLRNKYNVVIHQDVIDEITY